MRTDTSFVVVSREPALLPGMRHFSKATKGVLAALAVMLVSFGTSALAADGPYVGIGGSLSILNDSAVTAPEREPFKSLNANATTDSGFAVRGMAGYAFPSGLRVEAEIDYRRHKTDKMDVNSAGGVALSAFAKQPRFNPMGLPARELLDEYRALPKRRSENLPKNCSKMALRTHTLSTALFPCSLSWSTWTMILTWGHRGNPMSAAASGSLPFRSMRSLRMASRSWTTEIPSLRIRWVEASATSFPCRRAVRSPSAWTGDTSGPRPRASLGS